MNILLSGCVDVWDPKIVRSADGAQFSVAIRTDLTWTDIDDILPTDSRLFLADNCSRTSESKCATPNIILSTLTC